VFLGAGLGGVARFGLTSFATARLGPDFPWGTLIANVAGSLAIGLIYGALTRFSNPDLVRHLAVIGFLGGFTTFSSFSFEAMALARSGNLTGASLYVLASVALSLGAVAVGFLATGAKAQVL